MKRVAIIGGGAAGLCMARYLGAKSRMFNYVIYEKGKGIGGTWAYDDNIPSLKYGHTGVEDLRSNKDIHSSMYKNLRTNLPKHLMEFPDLSFPQRLKSFVSHKDVLAYLGDYATHFGITKQLRLNNSVTSVKAIQTKEKASDVIWKVSSIAENSNAPIEEAFDAVIVCNGHFTKPSIPDIPGINNFKGSVQHSHLYRVADQYKDKTVLVLGGSASGRDIAVEISRCANEVLLCHRGELGMCELPSNVKERPSIKMIADDGSVVLNDATQCSVDGIVFCTGYLYDFPFLHESCGVKVERNRVSPLYKQMFNVNHPSMAFIGVPSIVCPFHLFSIQARWVMKVLEGTAILPSKEEMLEDCDEELRSRLEAGIPEKYFHRFDKGENLDYFTSISNLAKVEPFKVVFEKMFLKVKQERERNLLYYRDQEYIVKNDEEFELVSGSNTV